MNPEAPLFSTDVIGKTPIVAVLIAMVVYFHRRDVRNDAKADKRHAACEERNIALETRVATLEDRQFRELKALAEDGLNGLQANTSALLKFLHSEDLTPPESFPAVPSKREG